MRHLPALVLTLLTTTTAIAKKASIPGRSDHTMMS